MGEIGRNLLIGQDYRINHVNHPVRLENIGDGYGLDTAFFILQHNTLALHHYDQHAATNRF